MTSFYSFTAVYFRWKLKIKQVCTWAVDERGTKSYEDGMQQQGKSFYAHDFSMITIPNEENLYQSSALTPNQYPFLFALDIKRTYDYYETGKWHEHNIRISTPGEGLTMRQSFLQISVTPEWQ